MFACISPDIAAHKTGNLNCPYIKYFKFAAILTSVYTFFFFLNLIENTMKSKGSN